MARRPGNRAGEPPPPTGGGEPAAPANGTGRVGRRRGRHGTVPGAMSIGEVLAVLKPEFNDITVSKIRFLEGAGLIRPSRSASGYRMFSEEDVARLRFVLRAQRDHYLPLRVIRQRLDRLEAAGKSVTSLTGAEGELPPPEPAAEQRPPDPPSRGLFDAPPSDAQLTREELCRAAGAEPAQLVELETYGLISPRGGEERSPWYGGDDMVLLRIARELAAFGLEGRHLRMYKIIAEREAALFEQVVAPILRQRNPEARQRARETLETLAMLGGRMREVLLRAAVSDLVDSRTPRR